MSELITPNRRLFLTGMASLVAAPSLVRASSLMPIKGELLDPWVVALNLRSPGEVSHLVISYFDAAYDDNNPISTLNKLRIAINGMSAQRRLPIIKKAVDLYQSRVLTCYTLARKSEVDLMYLPVIT